MSETGGEGFICPMCSKAIDLNIDDTADEDGHVMHAECYFKRVGGHPNTQPVCPICGKACILTDCVTDAKGRTIHRECYRAALIEGRESL